MIITIRKAKKEDAAEFVELLRYIGKLHTEARPDIYSSSPNKFDSIEKAEALFNDNRGGVLVAEVDGKVVGELIYKIMEQADDGFWTPRKWLYIDDLCVHPDYQRHNIATMLNEGAERIARDNKCCAVQLNCWAFNTKAAKFYEKSGYKPQKTEYEKKLD